MLCILDITDSNTILCQDPKGVLRLKKKVWGPHVDRQVGNSDVNFPGTFISNCIKLNVRKNSQRCQIHHVQALVFVCSSNPKSSISNVADLCKITIPDEL